MGNDVLVTGANGFLGRHLVSALSGTGRRVHAHSIADGDVARCELRYEGVGHVFHLAARVFVPESWRDPLPFYETNVLGTVNVLEFCRRTKASITFLSSYVYGRPRRLPVGEDHPLEAFNPYAQTKLFGEQICRFYESSFGVAAAIVRPFNLYGEGQDPRFLIPLLVRQALDPALDAITVADLRPRRDHLYVGDFVKLLVRTIGRSGTYNAGSGVSHSIEELVAVINRAAGVAKPVRADGQERPTEILDVAADIGKARREFGWAPETGLAEGIGRVVEAMRERPAHG